MSNYTGEVIDWVPQFALDLHEKDGEQVSEELFTVIYEQGTGGAVLNVTGWLVPGSEPQDTFLRIYPRSHSRVKDGLTQRDNLASLVHINKRYIIQLASKFGPQQEEA